MPPKPPAANLQAIAKATASKDALKTFLSQKSNAQMITASPAARQAFIAGLNKAGFDKSKIDDILSKVAEDIETIKWT